jgi:lipid-binding SYLF domain-containing protein
MPAGVGGSDTVSASDISSGMRLSIPSLMLLAVGCSQPPKSPAEARASNHDRAVEELADAAQVLDEMNQIAERHRERARCVAVIPSLVRAGLIVGGRHGDGVVSCRTPSGWSSPAFISISGGSAGLQVGVESSDVVMLVMSDRAKAQLFRSDFALGADASASAGPVGEAAQAGTDGSMTAEILSYARSRGLFAGAELSGVVVKQDMDALTSTYGGSPDVHAILAGDVAAPREASALLSKLAAQFPETKPVQ